MRDPTLVANIIKSTIDQFEGKYGHEDKYERPVREMAAVKLGTITLEDVARIVEYYLYSWGRMGRVLGREEYYGWQSKVASFIIQFQNQLGSFRLLPLLGEDLCKYETTIKAMYQALVSAVGPIGAAKILHLVCPSFFPLWDNAIANGLRQHYYGDSTYDSFSDQDYFNFMMWVQNWLRVNDSLVSTLSKQYTKTKLKIIDEFFWWTVTSPFSLVV
jgi:hypothetical protein